MKVAIYVYVTDEVDISNQLVNAFQIRVGAAGGVVEASECLLTQLESIGYSGTIPVAKRLELFNDEKISVNSTIQNISDISKIYTDFSQGFTIPCSTVNNEIFQHFYQNDVDATISYQFRFDAYIEIDTKLFRRGKIQFEKANLKNGYPDSYSITFYGTGVSLKDKFLEDKLSQLNYSTLDHNYTNAEVYNRVTIDSSVTDYNVRYPLISSNRVWQFGSSFPLPTANLPNWYTYPTSNINNINHASGAIVFTELFPAVRVASIFDLIETQYGITFNGLFLLSDFFRKAFLFFKNKGQVNFIGNASDLDFLTTSNPNVFFLTTNKFGLFYVIPSNIFVNGTLQFNCSSITPNPTTYYIDVYNNNVYVNTLSGTTTGGVNQFNINIFQSDVLSFKVRSGASAIINFNFLLTVTTAYAGSYNTSTATATATVSTNTNTNLSALAPDMKISDFVSGICKEFNLTVYSNTENVYTFDPIDYWYQGGAVIDITEYTDVTSIEVERMKLYKSIEFKYQDSECMLNKYFLESPLNADAHGYGNTKIGFNYDGGEFKIESPFENLLHNNFGNKLQVGYCLNKELAPYIPKPVLLYMNNKATLTSGHIHWNGQANITGYVPFGQDAQTLSQTGLINFSLNFGSEISTFYLVNNQYTIYDLYYKNYLVNLYNPKNRLVKVKTILPVSLLTNLKLNDRLIIRDKRYFINEMKTELTTREVDFTLISDFNPVQPTMFSQVPDEETTELKFAIIFFNDVFQVTATANTADVILSETVFTNEDFLTVTTPNFNIGKLIEITLLSEFNNGNTETNYIIIEQI